MNLLTRLAVASLALAGLLSAGTAMSYAAAATASQEGNRLELRRADGALAVSLARGPAS
jgi:hypothetical protein